MHVKFREANEYPGAKSQAIRRLPHIYNMKYRDELSATTPRPNSRLLYCSQDMMTIAITPQPSILDPSPSCRTRFDQLVKNLSDVLGQSSGLDSADINPQDIVTLMEAYTSNPDEWEKFALADSSRSYTRNLVDKGNGKSNLLVLVWSPGRGSPIHDHSNAHCVMKVLHGKLKETLYDWPSSNGFAQGSTTPPRIKKETLYGEGEVTYMSDEMGIHRIENPDPEKFAVSLHRQSILDQTSRCQCC